MTLFLIGYMGSGKTVIAKALAEILSFRFIDFDDYIEIQEGATIRTIFEEKGEVYFRKAEHDYLKDILNIDNTIIALGGGTPCYGNNMKALLGSKNTHCIYLKTKIPTLIERLFEERKKRPLISHLESKEALQEFIGKHLFERAPIYEQSQIIVNTDGQSKQEIAEAIIAQLF